MSQRESRRARQKGQGGRERKGAKWRGPEASLVGRGGYLSWRETGKEEEEEKEGGERRQQFDKGGWCVRL